MNFDVQKITAPLDLGGYDAAYAGQVIHVWMNLPAALRQKRLTLLRGFAREAAAEMRRKPAMPETWWFRYARKISALLNHRENDGMDALMAEVWSAGADAEAHWNPREVRTLQAADPLLYAWAARESWRMVDAWQEERKKKS